MRVPLGLQPGLELELEQLRAAVELGAAHQVRRVPRVRRVPLLVREAY